MPLGANQNIGQQHGHLPGQTNGPARSLGVMRITRSGKYSIPIGATSAKLIGCGTGGSGPPGGTTTNVGGGAGAREAIAFVDVGPGTFTVVISEPVANSNGGDTVFTHGRITRTFAGALKGSGSNEMANPHRSLGALTATVGSTTLQAGGIGGGPSGSGGMPSTMFAGGAAGGTDGSYPGGSGGGAGPRGPGGAGGNGNASGNGGAGANAGANTGAGGGAGGGASGSGGASGLGGSGYLDIEFFA